MTKKDIYRSTEQENGERMTERKAKYQRKKAGLRKEEMKV